MIFKKTGSRQSRGLIKNFIFNAGYQIVVSLTPLITTPYLARVLGPEISGVYSYTFSVANYFVIFATLGVSTYGVRAIAQCGNNEELRSRRFCGVYAAQLLAGIPVFAAYLLYVACIHSGGLLVSLVWGLYVLYAVLDVSWLLFGCEEFKIPTVRSIVTRLGMVAFILLFVRSADDLWLYCLATAASYFLNAALIWPFVGRYVRYVAPSLKEVICHLRANIGLFVPVVAYSLYTTINDVLLGAISTIDQVAFYDYSYKVSRILLHVVTALGTVMLPRMTQSFSEGRRSEGISLLGTSIWSMFVGSYALMFGVCAVAPEFTPVFFGRGYDICAPLMSLLSLLMPFVTITNVIGRQYLLPLGRDAEYTRSILAGAAANVCLASVLIPWIGVWGAVVGTMAADIVILIMQVHYAKDELPISGYVRQSLPFFVIGLMMFTSVRVASCLVSGLNPVAKLLVEIIVGVFVYAALSFAWCLRTRDEHFIRLFGRYISE